MPSRAMLVLVIAERLPPLAEKRRRSVAFRLQVAGNMADPESHHAAFQRLDSRNSQFRRPQLAQAPVKPQWSGARQRGGDARPVSGAC